MMIEDVPKKVLKVIDSMEGVTLCGTHILLEVGLRSFLIYTTDLEDYRFGVKSYFDILEFANKLSGDYGQSTNICQSKIHKTIYCEEFEEFGLFTEINSISLGGDESRDFTIIEVEGERKMYPSFIFAPILEILNTDSLQMLENNFPDLVKILRGLNEREKMASN